jgi:predicted RNA binding protein YcfA (HicA-like mRNA interferase family)
VKKLRYEDVARLLTQAGWEFLRQKSTRHQRWKNSRTGECTTISFAYGKLERYQIRNLEKQFKVKLLEV